MSWKAISLGEITEVVTKGTTPSAYGMSFSEEGINFIKAGALNGDVSLDRNGFTYINEETHEKLNRSKLCENDVLITIAGANVGKCGFVHIFDVPANTNQAVGIVRVKPELANPKFVYYHFKNPITFTHCQAIGGGQAAQPNINLTMLKRLNLSLPDLDYQNRVVDVISGYENSIRNNHHRIQLLEESARLLYKEWFVNLRFPGHEHVKIIDGVPEGWTKEPLGNLLTLQRGFDLPTRNRRPGLIPIYASTGINGFHDKAKVKGPGVVTGRSGSLGTVMYVTRDHWPLNTALWVKEFKKITPVISTFILRALKLENYNGGAAVPTLNRNDVHKIEVLCPSGNLIREFDLQAIVLFEHIEKLKEYNRKLSEARDILLPRLMNGDLVV